VVVVILLASVAACLLLSFGGLIRKGLDVVIVRFVTRVHHCHFLPIYPKIRNIGFTKGHRSFLRRIKLNKGKILEPSTQLVLYLSDVANRGKGLENFQEITLVHFGHHVPA
jgi:hypothetical protein